MEQEQELEQALEQEQQRVREQDRERDREERREEARLMKREQERHARILKDIEAADPKPPKVEYPKALGEIFPNIVAELEQLQRSYTHAVTSAQAELGALRAAAAGAAQLRKVANDARAKADKLELRAQEAEAAAERLESWGDIPAQSIGEWRNRVQGWLADFQQRVASAR